MRSVTVLAPAKLNLTLDVTGTRPDGYHTLDMIMQAVSLRERVTLRRSRGLSLSLPGSRVPANEHNTAYKAALAFFPRHGPLGGRGHHGGKACARARGHGGRQRRRRRRSGGAERAVRRAPFRGRAVRAGRAGGRGRAVFHCGRHGPGYRCGRYPGAAEALPALLFYGMYARGRHFHAAGICKVRPHWYRRASGQRGCGGRHRTGDLAGLCAQMKNALEYSSASAATKPICETLRAHGARQR